MVRMAVGVPAFAFLMFGLVVAYRLTGRSTGDLVFWVMLGTLLAGMAIYLLFALYPLLKHRGRPEG